MRVKADYIRVFFNATYFTQDLSVTDAETIPVAENELENDFSMALHEICNDYVNVVRLRLEPLEDVHHMEDGRYWDAFQVRFLAVCRASAYSEVDPQEVSSLKDMITPVFQEILRDFFASTKGKERVLVGTIAGEYHPATNLNGPAAD